MEQEILARFRVIFIAEHGTREAVVYNSDCSKEQVLQGIRDTYGEDVIILSVEKVTVH